MLTYWTEHTDLLGDITIQCNDELISAIQWGFPGLGQRIQTPVSEVAFTQLNEYLSGQRREFSLPLLLSGTPFMQKVYGALMEIPYGRTESYENIAIRAGRPRASRAVGSANHRNPLPIVVPCHRVVRKDGGLGGFAPGLIYKERLLALERNNAIR